MSDRTNGPAWRPPRRQLFVSLLVAASLLLQGLGLVLPSTLAPPAAHAVATPPDLPAATVANEAAAPSATRAEAPLPAPVVPSLPSDAGSSPALLGASELTDWREENVRHYDLGGGHYLAYVSPTPLHYRDDESRWQPIEPVFTAIPGGWSADRNSLPAALGDGGARVQVEAGGVPLSWESRHLEAIGSGGEAMPLAAPLPSGDGTPGTLAPGGRTVHFEGAWGRPDVSTTFTSDAGALKQEIVVEGPELAAALAGRDAEWLSLPLLLTFPAGVQVYADGKVQTGAFATAGTLELRGLNGSSLLAFQPPTAYELPRPDLAVAGRFQATPGEGGIVLAAQIPAAWWLDAARQYPAAVSLQAFVPTMQVLRDLENAYVAQTRYYDDPGEPAGPPVTPMNINQQLTCVGNTVKAESEPDVLTFNRGYVRFPLPNLPFGVSAPSQAFVVAVPDNSLTHPDPSHIYYADRLARLPTYLVQMTEDWTDDLLTPGQTTTSSFPPGMASPGANPNDLAMIKKREYGWPAAGALPATIWDVTPVVQGWYTNPGTNFGFALRMLHEGHHYFEESLFWPIPGEATITHTSRMCFPSSAGWSNLDDVVAHLDNPAVATADGPGLGLLVRYNAPQLAGDTLLRTRVPSALPLQSYRYQFHEYRLPTPQANRWQIVAAQATRGINGWSPNTPLDLADANGQVLVSSYGLKPAPVNAAFEYQPGYLVVNGQQGDLAARVQPDNQPEFDQHDANPYTVQTRYANPSPSLPTNVATQVPMALSNELVMAQELNLATNTTVEMRVPYASVLPAVSPAQAAVWDLQVFPPGAAYGSRDVGGMKLMPGPDAYEVEFSVSAGQNGRWLLVLQSQQSEISVTMPVQVTICQNTDQVVRYPLDGKCVELRRPPANFTNPDHYKELGSGPSRLRLYSPAGFDCTGNVCTTRPQDPADVPVMPLLGYGNDSQRWVALKNGTFTLDPGQNKITSSAGARLVMADFSDPVAIASVPVLRGAFEAVPGGGTVQPTSLPAGTYLLVKSPLHVSDDNGGEGNKNGWSYRIDLVADRLRASGPLTRSVQPNKENPAVLFNFNAEWSIDVSGGPSLQGGIALVNVSAPNATFNVGTLLVTAPNAGYSLEHRLLDAIPGVPAIIPAFAHIRMAGATLLQPLNLGGAKLPVQALLLPPGKPVKDEQGTNPSVFCGTSCFDLRGPADQMLPQGHAVDRQYTMPDLIIQDSAGTIMINTEGRLEVFSTDHPRAGELLRPDGVLGADAVSFSYEAFDATVRTFYGMCPGPRDPLNPNNPPSDAQSIKTTVVVGQASMSLPNAESGTGDDGNDSRIEIGFVLCDNSLREMSFSFSTGNQYALPIGNSGLWVHLVGGTVSLAPKQPGEPGYTTIVLRFGFRGMDMSAAASNLFFVGQVTIDSRGLFDVQTQAGIKVLSTGVGVDGHFWVAWSPLDLGFVVDACLPRSINPSALTLSPPLCAGDELLYGMLKLHVWQGQGWQNRYSWLPDDDAIHAAARFEAYLTIGMGDIVEAGLLILPPGDIVLAGLKLAFGEFCMNSSCTQYEWGVMGAFVILGYDVGAYYGFDSGISFIMGSADYVLIDEAGTVLARNPASLQLMERRDAAATSQVIAIQPGLPSALFALGATASGASLTLREPAPGNRVITTNPSAPASPDLQFYNAATPRGYHSSVAVANPLPGDWKVEINGVDAGPFNFAYFANNSAPKLSFETLPIQAIDQPAVPLRWTSDIGEDAQAYVSLYYELITDPLSRPVSGPIVERLPLESSGEYDWDVTGLATGSYQVYARIDSNASAVANACPDQTYNPDPRKQGPCGLMLAPKVILPVDRIDAPGSIRILDRVPPAPPLGFKLRPEGPSSVVGRWRANAEKDLAGYILTCGQSQVALVRSARVSAAIEFTSALSETARINGLSAVPATCFVQAYDASGNLSAPSASQSATPTANIPLPPAAVQNIQVAPGSLGDVLVQWQSSLLAYGYLVFYHVLSSDDSRSAQEAPGTLLSVGGGYQADQGPSPLVTYGTSQALTGLPGGASYNLWVVPFDVDGRTGRPSMTVTFTVTQGSTIYLPLVASQ
jgi:hypothetical protein